MIQETILRNSQKKAKYYRTTTDLLSVDINTIVERENELTELLFITSYPPRECGIATYSQDLINALTTQFGNSFTSSICALESDTEQHKYLKQPKYILNTQCQNSYVKNAYKINNDKKIKLVVIQHEFGFFANNELKFKQFLQFHKKAYCICISYSIA